MTPIEDRLLEIADDHDRRSSRLSDRKNAASERQASLAIRAALLSIATLRVERDALRSENADLRKHADRVAAAVLDYFDDYMLDEADDQSVCSAEQHEAATRVRNELADYRARKEGKK